MGVRRTRLWLLRTTSGFSRYLLPHSSSAASRSPERRGGRRAPTPSRCSTFREVSGDLHSTSTLGPTSRPSETAMRRPKLTAMFGRALANLSPTGSGSMPFSTSNSQWNITSGHESLTRWFSSTPCHGSTPSRQSGVPESTAARNRRSHHGLPRKPEPSWRPRMVPNNSMQQTALRAAADAER
jgi:hypothetical protein